MNAISFLSEPIVGRLGWTLIYSLWQGVVIAAALAGVLRLLRAAPANLRYLASCAAMGMLVLAAAITFTQLEVEPTPIVPPANSSAGGLPFAASPVPTTPVMSARIDPSTPPHAQLRWVVLIWATGVLVMSLWHIGGWLWLTRMRRGNRLEQWEPTLAKLKGRLGIGRAVALIETARIDVPAVIGALRPVILVPLGIFSGLTPQQVEAILAHELAHIRRHDYLVNLIQSAVETLMFHHPATWWISAQIRRERENCCDDIAAAMCADERAYAAALAALEARCARNGLPFALAATDGTLLDRVRRLLHLPPTRRSSRLHSLTATILAIGCVALPLACVTAPRTLGAQTKGPVAPTTSPTRIVTAPGEFRFVKVVVGRTSMLVQDKPIDWAELKKVLGEIPESQRGKTVLEIAAAAPDITVERFFSVSAQLSDLVKQFGLAYLSHTGIQPTTRPDLPEGTESGEYYITGVKRVGIYSLTARKITLKQALIAAGGTEADPHLARITVIRRDGDDEKIVVKDLPVDDLVDLRAKDVYLRANDIVQVKPETNAGAAEIEQLTARLEELRARQAQLKQQFSAQHPNVREVQQQIEEITRLLSERQRRIGEPTTQP